MSKRSDAQWGDASEPEISVGALIKAHGDDFTGAIIGERFGKYLLVGEIAVGGMAEVFLAVQKGVEGFIKAVVIKRVLPHLTTNPDFNRMFLDEARLEARLEHPNIVRTYEFGEVDGQYFTVMEYLAGEDLFKALNNLAISRQRMPLHIAAGITSQICTGLHFAHHFTDTAGRPLHLVHRDINPANIVITYGGEVKIIDFGVAKCSTNVNTINGMIKGKVAYMPPEQVLDREVDQRADIFSAGVVLWEMLTGKQLFLRNSEAATLYAVMNGPIPPPSKLRSDVPPELDTVVARALDRSPAARFDTAEQMGNALEDVMAHLPRYDARVLASKVEELFGSTRAEAKRSIAQTRALTRNISMVMKLRTEVRADLAERLDAVVNAERAPPRETRKLRHTGDGDPPPAETQAPEQASPASEPSEASRSQRGLFVVLALIMVACIAAGLAYTLSRSERREVVTTKSSAQSAVQIDSIPPGAAVFVEGEPTGLKTPTKLTGITKKQLMVRLELPGHGPVTSSIELSPGETSAIQATLIRLQGRLVIADLPSSATIFVDTDEYSAGDVIPVAAGKHTIRIVIDGHTVVEQSTDTTTGDQVWKFVGGRLVRN